MNNGVTRMDSLLTGVRMSIRCWHPEDAIIHTILMVMFSLPAELLDEIYSKVMYMCNIIYLVVATKEHLIRSHLYRLYILPGFG